MLMVDRRSMADIQVAAKEACANKDSSAAANADASVRVGESSQQGPRQAAPPELFTKR